MRSFQQCICDLTGANLINITVYVLVFCGMAVLVDMILDVM